MLIEPFFTFVAEAILNTIIENLTADTKNKIFTILRGDPAKRAFQQALGKAITKYAQGERLLYAQALTRDGGLLHDKIILAELGKLISIENIRPDINLIGKHWRDALDSPPVWRNFTQEADIFVRYLESSLRTTDVFHPFFDSRNLESIVDNTEISVEALQALERQMANLNELMAQGFGTFVKQYTGANITIRDQIHDFSAYIEEKTRSFVGRQFVFDAIRQFINANTRGYLIIKGDPGIGKTAISAQLVKQHGYAHHFNIRSDGINKASDFLKNICTQLIAVYNLDYSVLPVEATQDAGFLSKLLNEISQKLSAEKCMIIIDALDEADNVGISTGVNTLYLPSMLPKGIFIVVTMRREDEKTVRLRIDIPEQKTLEIKQDEASNIADVREYVVGQTVNAGIQAYIMRNGINENRFVELLVERSQGNFIYLRLILPEIEQGYYQDLALDQIPLGLQNYYESHWWRIKHEYGLDWFEYRLPVVLALTVMKKPVSISLIMEYSDVNDRRRVNEVLRDFDQFLYEAEIEYDRQLTKCYRWYHTSFFDFIGQKEAVKDEVIDLRKAAEKVANKMWIDLFGDVSMPPTP